MFHTREGAARAAKDLRKALRAAGSEQSLSACQETVARHTGYTDWHDALLRIEAGQPIRSTIDRRTGIKAIVAASRAGAHVQGIGPWDKLVAEHGAGITIDPPPIRSPDSVTQASTLGKNEGEAWAAVAEMCHSRLAFSALLGRSQFHNPTLKLACTMYADFLSWSLVVPGLSRPGADTDPNMNKARRALMMVFALRMMAQTGYGLGAACTTGENPPILLVAEKLAFDAKCRRSFESLHPSLFDDLRGDPLFFSVAESEIIKQDWRAEDDAGASPSDYGLFQSCPAFNRNVKPELADWEGFIKSGNAPARLEMPGFFRSEVWKGLRGRVSAQKSLWPGHLEIQGPSGSGKSLLAAGLLKCVRNATAPEKLSVRLVSDAPDILRNADKEGVVPDFVSTDLIGEGGYSCLPNTFIHHPSLSMKPFERLYFILDAIILHLAAFLEQKEDGPAKSSLLILDYADDLCRVNQRLLSSILMRLRPNCAIWLIWQKRPEYFDFPAYRIECERAGRPSRITTPMGEEFLFERPEYLIREDARWVDREPAGQRGVGLRQRLASILGR